MLAALELLKWLAARICFFQTFCMAFFSIGQVKRCVKYLENPVSSLNLQGRGLDYHFKFHLFWDFATLAFQPIYPRRNPVSVLRPS
jgi:hypothetical protein